MRLSINYSLYQTSCTFPSLANSVKSSCVLNCLPADIFTQIYCFCLFGFGDWLGKFLADYIRIYQAKDGRSFLYACLSRCGIVSWLLIIKTPSYDGFSFFGIDPGFIFTMALLSISHGYASTVACQFLGERVDGEFLGIAGGLLPICIIGGVGIGSCVSFLMIINGFQK